MDFKVGDRVKCDDLKLSSFETKKTLFGTVVDIIKDKICVQWDENTTVYDKITCKDVDISLQHSNFPSIYFDLIGDFSPKKKENKDFPDTCPFCEEASYNQTFLGGVDCSKKCVYSLRTLGGE